MKVVVNQKELNINKKLIADNAGNMRYLLFKMSANRLLAMGYYGAVINCIAMHQLLDRYDSLINEQFELLVEKIDYFMENKDGEAEHALNVYQETITSIKQLLMELDTALRRILSSKNHPAMSKELPKGMAVIGDLSALITKYYKVVNRYTHITVNTHYDKEKLIHEVITRRDLFIVKLKEIHHINRMANRIVII